MSDTPETPPREVPRTEDGTDTRDASAVSNRSEKAQHVPEARKRTARSIREAEDGTGTRGVGKIADLERLIETLRAEIVGWKQMERALNAERQRFFDVLEALPAYLVLLTPDYHVPLANRFFRDRFGESNGRRCYEYLFGRSEPCETCETFTVLKSGQPHRWEWTGPDGRNYDIFDFPFQDADGSPLILEMGIDITDRKKAEEALQASIAYNRSLIEASLDPLVTINPDGTINDVNNATVRVTGFTREELIGTDFSNYFTDPAKAKAGYEKVFRDGSVMDYELEIRHRNGRITPVLYNATVYRDEMGNVSGVFAAARDITAQKRAEGTIRRAYAYTRSLIEASLDPLVTISAEGTITDVNEATVRATGFSREELIGTDFSRYFTEPERAKAGYEQVFRDGSVTDYELWIRHRNGKTTPVLYNATVFKDESGQVTGVFAAARDVTERKRAEDALMKAYNELDDRVKERTAELLEANRHLEREIAGHKATAEELMKKSEELERSNLELQQFAYVASHDLQEPLRAISGFTELLEKRYKGELDERADRYIHFIMDGTNRMQQVIQDLLAYSRVQTQAREFGPIDTNMVLDQALLNLRTSIKDTNAIITRDPLPEVVADRTQITQVFQNLVGNALKFQKPETVPCIHVSATREGYAWRFSVRDNGIGIDPRHQDRIFVIFQRLHARGEYEGTGIGLAICKRIVERHGGRIWVESEPGVGSTFFFTIPCQKEVKA
ncbi:MAG: PAS domain S-box protein [Methanomicrobiales archaeon]|nr:PAS domain S-box protein [Methanomicrobiales archaeon]MDI6877472.1 PAS domain S-box protein [Methanomicrobiales archaeon]